MNIPQPSTPRPWSDPFDRRPGDVIVNGPGVAYVVVEVRQRSTPFGVEVGEWSADYLVRRQSQPDMKPVWARSDSFWPPTA